VNLIVLSIPVFFALIALEVVWDRWRGLGLYRLGDTLANIGCGIMDQSSGLFSKILTVGAYTAVFHATAGARSWEFSTGWTVWIAAFILTDLAYYWAHRLSHEVNLLWIGHSVHHQSEDYNLGVALRQSVLQKVLLMWVYWPLAVMGFPPEMFLMSMAINLLYQFWIHTELVDRMGPLEWVLNTPSHHRVHHGRNPEYIDRNHAGVLIIWDRMFGTFQEEIVKPTYGVTRPTDSFNPVYAQWKPVADLWRDLRAIPSWMDRLRFLFAPPGWYPDSVGGPQSAPDITGEEVKFNPRPSTGVALALLFRWVLLLAIALGALQAAAVVSTPTLALMLGWVFSALAATGELWNHGWSAWRMALAMLVDVGFVAVGPVAFGLTWEEGAAWLSLPALASVVWTYRSFSASRRR